MDLAARIVLRFVLVPVGYLAAVVVGTLVILFGSWRMGEVATASSDAQAVALLGYLFAGAVLLVVLLSVMWLLAAIGILISEGFAIRSWMYHAGNGGLSALVGWSMFGYVDDSHVAINQPLPVIAAGLAGGLAYWAIAGWSAGPQKPIFARPQALPSAAVPPLRGPVPAPPAVPPVAIAPPAASPPPS